MRTLLALRQALGHIAPMGRPSSYTQEIALIVCERLVEGQSLRSICRDEAMPGITTVMAWLIRHPEFEKQYAHARDAQADTLADEILEICDDGRNDWMEKLNRQGEVVGWAVNGEAVQRSKLRVETRKWAASKLKPKRYGERIEHAGTLGVTLTDLVSEALTGALTRSEPLSTETEH